MRQKIWKKGMVVVLAWMLAFQIPFAVPGLFGQAYAYTERQAVTNASSLNVRSGPGTSYSRVASLGKGTAVTVVNEVNGSDGKRWYQIRFSGGTGYVLGTYIRFPVTYNQDSNFEAYLTAQGFPESYKPALRQLHAQYPSWIFEAQQTGLDWNTVIQNESIIPRSLIHKNSISSHKSTADGAYNWDNGTWTGFDGSSWVAASEDIIRYYMDPRNFLDDVYIFQFMSHGYDAFTQTREGLQALVKGTFLDGNTTGGSLDGWNSSGNTQSAGPGGSSSQGSSGVVVSPGASGGSGGPGASGQGTGSPGSSSGSSGDQGVRLRGPQASISRHDAARVATVRVGVKPGQGGSGGGNSQGGTLPSPGSSSQGSASSPVVAPGGSSQGGALPSPGGSQGGGSGGTSPSPGGSSQGGSSAPTVVSPGGNSSPSGSGSSSSGNAHGGGGTIPYVDIIMQAAAASGVNPYVLTAMIIQEQGSDGRGNSISGTNSAYPGYYNYFNVGAYAADGMGAVERGLWYASQSGNYGRPWNTPEKSIIGGAQFYGDNYVRAGQDTFYLKKYNVQGSNLYKHQYMTNVDGAASEGSIFAESYSDTLKSMPLRFKIPVYTGMPDVPCAKPTGDGSPNNKLSSLGVNGFSLTPTFHRDTCSYNLIVDSSVSTVSVYANAIDSKAAINGTGNFQLSAGTNEIRVRVRAQNGSERDYVIQVVRQNGGAAQYGSGGGSPAGNGQAASVTGPGMSSSPGGSQTGAAPTPGGSNVIVISP